MTTQSIEIKHHDNVTLQVSPAALPHTEDLPEPAPPREVEAEHWRTFALESLKRKQRADSFFQSLQPAQQVKLIQWMDQEKSLGMICKRVAAPVPEGFGIDVHITSLERLRAHWKSLLFESRNHEVLDTIHDMESTGDFSQQRRIQAVISPMLHQKAFELVQTRPDSEEFIRILAGIEKLNALDYKREKLLLDRQKLLCEVGSPKHHRVDLNIVRPPEPKPILPANE